MRAIPLLVVLGSSAGGFWEVSQPTATAVRELTPAPTPEPERAPTRTWKSKSDRTAPAPWRRTPTPPRDATGEGPADPAPNENAATQAVEEKEIIVFTGKYRPGRWLCSRAPTPTSGQVFEITEVRIGHLPAKAVEVPHWLFDRVVVRPKELKGGTVYTLRLTPSEGTREYLREHQKRDSEYRLRPGDELEVIEIELQ